MQIILIYRSRMNWQGEPGQMHANATEDPNVSANVLGLTYAEHLIVWSLRRLAVGRLHCPLVAREFAEACGAEAGQALAAFRVLLWTLGGSGRRRLTVGPPGLLDLSRDEELLLAVFAAAQMGEEDRLRAHLAWLYGSGDTARLEAAVRVVACTLAEKGHRLRLPEPAQAAVRKAR
jgi:hypothetical protein